MSQARSRLRLLILCSLAGMGASACEPAAPEWTELFNGRDLAGWVPKIRGEPMGQDSRNTFRVEDGFLTVGYDAYDTIAGFQDAFGHLFHEAPHGAYELLVEYRFGGSQVAGGPDWARSNSGVMFHAQAPETMGLDQDFPVSLELQFLGAAPGEVRTTAALCTPGTHVDIDGEQVTRHCVEAAAPSILDGNWVLATLIAGADGSVRHVLDGDTVLAYERPVVGGGEANDLTDRAPDPGTELRSGYIALQSESHPIQFRRVAIRPLGS